MTPEELRSLADEATPGPWTVADIPNGQSVRIALGGHDSFRFFAHTSENARLIALAPDLARLCAELGKALEAILEHNPPEVVKDDFAYDRLKEAYCDCARAALAKLSELKP